jgi:uncharacterized protein
MMVKMTGIAWSAVKIALAVYIGLSILLYFMQSKYVFYPRRKLMRTPVDEGLYCENVLCTTQDGETVAGWYVPGAGYKSTGKAVMLCHGNAENMGDRVETILTFQRMGYDTLVFDYRGYGSSTGRPTEEGTYLDALAAWNYLKGEKSIPADRIVVYGCSLGGAVATWLAAQVHPGVLVLESTFTSAPDMARRIYPYLPVKLICRFQYNSLSLINKVRCPVFIAHSPQDEMIPWEHGRALFDKAREPKKMFSMSGGHNDGGLDADSEYQRELKAFLAEHVK